jgi:hypothetical protein
MKLYRKRLMVDLVLNPTAFEGALALATENLVTTSLGDTFVI